MFFMHEGQTLYLSSWKYNSALIVERIQGKAKEAGYTVAEQTGGFVVNRSLLEAVNEKREKVERLENRIESGRVVTKEAEKHLEQLRNDLAEISAINNEPVPVHGSYVRFYDSQYMYYLGLDENPFSPSYFNKAPITESGKYVVTFSEELPTDWVNDCFLRMDCPDVDLEKAAGWIFDHLTRAEAGKVYTEKNRKRVPNTYNDGYHFETVVEPPRLRDIETSL